MRKSPARTADILRSLAEPLFRTADLAKLTPDANMFLYRATKKRYVKRIANRVYWNALFHPSPPLVEQVACYVRQPSYISCEWALHAHGILLQRPQVCTAITLHSAVGKAKRIPYEGYLIEYSRITERLYLLEEIQNQDGILMATPEKALLDAVYLRRQAPFQDELEWEDLDKTKLEMLLAVYPPRVRIRMELKE